MLGINVKKDLVSGSFAKEIRDRANRILKGQLSEKDVQEIDLHRKAVKDIKVVWL